MFIGSSVRIDTHLFAYVPNKYLAVYFMKHHKKSGMDVFVQHGITHNWQDCFFRENNKSDIVICGAKQEYEYLLTNFNLGKDVLKYTGFPRYDSLINCLDEKDKYILVMPTWRNWLSKLNENDFKKSDFFINYSKLIQNKDLITWAKDNQYSVVFYLHPSLYKYRKVFSEFSNDIVDVVSTNRDIQELLCGASALITDYSSILFDFAYLRKPTVYFHFDSDLFYSKQYKHGYFLIESDGFGPVGKTVEDMTKLIKDNEAIKKIYLVRINSFFERNDSNNSLRLFEEICDKL